MADDMTGGPGTDDCPDCGAAPGQPCRPGCPCDDCVDWREQQDASRCGRCGKALEPSPYRSTVFARCGDCDGGADPDGEAFRGGEAAAYAREQSIAAQRLK